MSFFNTPAFENLILTEPFIEYLRKESEKLSEAISGGKLLEIGCGDGRLISLLSTLADHYTGIDNSARMCVNAMVNHKDLLTKNVKILFGTAYRLPFKENKFDWIVMAWNTFGNFGQALGEDKIAALRQAKRVLKLGGKIIISVLDINSFAEYQEFIIKNDLHIIENQGNLIHLKEGLITERFSKQGLEELFSAQDMEFSISQLTKISLWAEVWKH